MAKPYLSVIVPVYNAADYLPLTLIDIDKHLSAQEYSYEILVVNDGSTDNTGKIAANFGDLIKNLKLIDNPDNQGWGPVIRLATAAAKGNVRVVMSARNSTPVTEFNKMMPYLREGHEALVGSNGYDFLCFSEEAAQDIFQFSRAGRWAFHYEALALAKKLGYKIKFMSALHRRNLGNFINPLGDPANFLGFMCFAWEMAKIRLRLLTFGRQPIK